MINFNHSSSHSPLLILVYALCLSSKPYKTLTLFDQSVSLCGDKISGKIRMNSTLTENLMQVVTAIRQYKIPFKSIYPFFLSLIIVPVVNAAYLLSLNLQSDPSMPASIGEQAAFEFWMLGGFIDFVRRGRFPSGNEILRLPRT